MNKTDFPELDKQNKRIRKIRFFERCFYHQVTLDLLSPSLLAEYFVHIKHTQRYRCIKSLTLKYIVADEHKFEKSKRKLRKDISNNQVK